MTSDAAEQSSVVLSEVRPNGSHHRVNYALRNNPEHRARVSAARKLLFTLPLNEPVEMPGHPTVVFELRDYGKLTGPGEGGRSEGATLARADMPFLFKAFESGQAPPPRPGTKKAEETRAATIHEYLDWTLTRVEGLVDDEKVTEKADFEGFLTIVLLPRHRVSWPAPGQITDSGPQARLGVRLPSLPALEFGLKPICAATIRSGVGYMEVPFFATHEGRRNKGYGRALLECIEEVSRALGLGLLMLCSTDDPVTKNTWRALGFSFTTDDDLRRFGVHTCDLLHMDNTVQMHKVVPARRVWHSIVLKHGDLRTRLYYPNDPRPERIKFARPPTKAPAKRKVSKKSKKSHINGMLSSD